MRTGTRWQLSTLRRGSSKQQTTPLVAASVRVCRWILTTSEGRMRYNCSTKRLTRTTANSRVMRHRSKPVTEHEYTLGIENQEWRDIGGYEGLYQVSNLGNIRNLKKGKLPAFSIMKQSVDKYGYCVIGLTKKGKRKQFFVHRLVMLNFIGTPKENLQVNHKNGVKIDNWLGNLEYVTANENMYHAYAVAGRKRKINHSDVFDIKQRLLSGEKPYVIALTYKVSAETIRRVGKRE